MCLRASLQCLAEVIKVINFCFGINIYNSFWFSEAEKMFTVVGYTVMKIAKNLQDNLFNVVSL